MVSPRHVAFVGLLLFVWSGAAPASGIGDAKEGEKIYKAYCEECHGADGRGRGPKAPFLSPKPGNFVSAATSAKSDRELLRIIADGVPRTAMKGWKTRLTEKDRINVLAYIRSLVRFQPPSLTPPPPGNDSAVAP